MPRGKTEEETSALGQFVSDVDASWADPSLITFCLSFLQNRLCARLLQGERGFPCSSTSDPCSREAFASCSITDHTKPGRTAQQVRFGGIIYADLILEQSHQKQLPRKAGGCCKMLLQ